MIVLLNNSKIVYESFDSQQEMSERLIVFITYGRTDYIVFRGQPKDIDGKQKRRFVLKEFKGDLNDIEGVKRYFNRKTNCRKHSWCLLYKNK